MLLNNSAYRFLLLALLFVIGSSFSGCATKGSGERAVRASALSDFGYINRDSNIVAVEAGQTLKTALSRLSMLLNEPYRLEGNDYHFKKDGKRIIENLVDIEKLLLSEGVMLIENGKPWDKVRVFSIQMIDETAAGNFAFELKTKAPIGAILSSQMEQGYFSTVTYLDEGIENRLAQPFKADTLKSFIENLSRATNLFIERDNSTIVVEEFRTTSIVIPFASNKNATARKEAEKSVKSILQEGKWEWNGNKIVFNAKYLETEKAEKELRKIVSEASRSADIRLTIYNLTNPVTGFKNEIELINIANTKGISYSIEDIELTVFNGAPIVFNINDREKEGSVWIDGSSIFLTVSKGKDSFETILQNRERKVIADFAKIDGKNNNRTIVVVEAEVRE